MLRANRSVIVRSRPPVPSSDVVPAADLPRARRIGIDHAAVVADRDRTRIGAPEHDLGGLIQNAGALQQRRQRRAGPARVPDRADQERQAGVARALHRERHLTARASLHVGERQRPRPGDQAADVQPVGGCRQRRVAVVADDEEVVSRSQPRVELLPDQQVLSDLRNGVRSGLIQPRDDRFAGSGEGVCRAGHLQGAEAGDRRASTLQQRATGHLAVHHGALLSRAAPTLPLCCRALGVRVRSLTDRRLLSGARAALGRGPRKRRPSRRRAGRARRTRCHGRRGRCGWSPPRAR